MFCIKISIKEKRTKPKESISLSLLLSLSKESFLEIVMFLTLYAMKELNLSYPPLWEEPLTLYQNLADVNSTGAQFQGNYYSFP